MIFDCLTFYNELELLEIRLAELKDVVDWFVLVEAAETFSGKPKPYIFEENRSRFKQYNVCYVRIPRFPASVNSRWQREGYSRDAAASGLNSLSASPGDIVMLSDVDEIPRPEVVARCAQQLTEKPNGACYVLEHPMSYYYVNCRASRSYYGTRIARREQITSLQALRESGGIFVRNGGWHFSFLGGAERMREKIQAYSHSEYDSPAFTDPDHLARCAGEETDDGCSRAIYQVREPGYSISSHEVR